MAQRKTPSGRYVITSTFGEKVSAFVPASLPPTNIDIGVLAGRLEKATQALGQLNGVANAFPSIGLFLYQYVRKEALLSSQIEGTQSSLSDLMLHEVDAVPGIPLDDVEEVCAYVAALQHGIQRLKAGFPLSLRLLREIHTVLLTTGRGKDKQPGEFRRSQNWLGGTRPGNAFYVPPRRTCCRTAWMLWKNLYTRQTQACRY